MTKGIEIRDSTFERLKRTKPSIRSWSDHLDGLLDSVDRAWQEVRNIEKELELKEKEK